MGSVRCSATISLTLLFTLFPAPATAQNSVYDISGIKWEKERIERGLVWKHAHTGMGDSLLQNINILVVNTRKRDVGIVYTPSEGRRPTSAQAAEAGALAAVNGGFFNASGGSVTYIRIGGVISDSDTSAAWPRNQNLNGAILTDAKGKVTLTRRQVNEWFDSKTEYTCILVTGPLLLQNGRVEVMPETSLVTSRHPRTAIGTSGRKRVMLVTVDGRTTQSYGLTLYQLAGLMRSLGCTGAVNLDGGGSTTMWISGKGAGGIVNMPCDNRIFDHDGERAVSSVVIVR